jgi:type I restriction enzyme, S subunit
MSSGTTPPRALYDRYFKDGSIAWVKTMDLTDAELLDTSEHITDLALEETSLKVYPPGTVLIAMYGGFQQIGRTGLLRIPAAVNQAITAIQPKAATIVAEYLLATLNYRVDYWKRVASSSRKDPNISSQEIRTFPIAYPSEGEQRAIAGALRDVDALLGGLERLIAKKRDLKQAAMQQLLTGQTRLPGFHEQWETKRLEEVGDIRSGGTPSTTQPQFWNGGVPWCTPTDITSLFGRKYLAETARTISAAGLQSSSAEVIPPRSLIMTSRATIGECAINLVPMTTNQGFKNIAPFADFGVEFLYYMMTTQTARLIALCGGSTFLEIGKKQLSAFEITLPKVRDEQTAIAAVLSDMDAELAALEARRNKTRDLKQAMMQELLTGRIRLV